MSPTSAWRLVAICLAWISALTVMRSFAADPPAVNRRAPIYKSPSEVLQAYRHASQAKDWQGVLNTETPRKIDADVYEAFCMCGLATNVPKGAEIARKYGIDSRQLWLDYERLYKAKHGVDIAKIIAERSANEAKLYQQPPPPQTSAPNRTGQVGRPGTQDYSKLTLALPEDDETLVRQALFDKLGKKTRDYYCDLQDAFGPFGDTPLSGELQNLVVTVNKAKGVVKQIYMVKGLSAALNGRSVPFSYPSETVVPLRFEKTEAGWLLDLVSGEN
jgi:hypothetical protein